MSGPLGLGVGLWPRPIAGGGVPAPPPISAIDATGWSAQWASGTPPTFTPDTAPSTFAVSRQGYTATAGTGDTATAATIAESRTLTQRVRRPAPNDATLTAATVAIDDYLYSTDTVAGVTNGSAEASPKPIAKWRVTPRRLVDSAVNSLEVALSADHRDGIACVVFSVTDGTTTLTRTVVTPVVANRTGDQGAVIEYQWTFDTTTLAAGRLTYSAKVYPRIGTAAAVLNSASQAVETRSFCNQYAVKGPKYFIYVATGGNDATAAVSTNAATASATPAATAEGAIARARAVMPGGTVSGLEVRLKAGTWANGGVAYNIYQDANSAEVVITRDPTVARANVIWSVTASNPAWYLNFLRLDEVTLVRSAYAYLGLGLANGAGGQVVFSNLNAD